MSREVLKPLLGKSELLLFIFFLFGLVPLSAKGFHATVTRYLHVLFKKSRKRVQVQVLPQTKPGSLAASIGCILTFSAQHLTPPYQLTPGLYWDQLNRQTCFLVAWFSGIWSCLFFYSWMLFVGFVFYGFSFNFLFKWDNMWHTPGCKIAFK